MNLRPQRPERVAHRTGVATGVVALVPGVGGGEALCRLARIRPPPARAASFESGESTGVAHVRHGLYRKALPGVAHEAAVNDGLLDPDQGTQLMDQLAGIARQIAVDALDQAIAQGGNPAVIA